MATIRIENVGAESIDRATKLLAGINGGISKAINAAMQRAVAHMRTTSTKAIREKYDISSTNIRAERNINTRYNYTPGGGVTAMVTFSGQKIPLYRYGGTSPKGVSIDSSKWVSAYINGFWKKVHPGLAASGHQMRGAPTVRFENAFIAQMGSGHKGIFERTGGASSSGSDAIREIMGSSVAQMLGNPDVSEKLATEAMDTFNQRMEHEILRIMNGWG